MKRSWVSMKTSERMIWRHQVDISPDGTVKIFDGSIGICQTSGGPGWKKLLASIRQWRKTFDRGFVLERIQDDRAGRQGRADTGCIHENRMPFWLDDPGSRRFHGSETRPGAPIAVY